MSEQTMTEENKKTIVAFIAGLLIGGLLVFIFANPADREEKRTDGNTVPEVTEQNGETSENNEAKQSENKIDVVSKTNQTVSLSNVTFPADSGWVGIRDYEGGQLTGLLGVARFNKAESLMPTEVTLLRPTVSGKTYAIVFYSDNGDKMFDLATDAQVDAEVSSFVAK